MVYHPGHYQVKHPTTLQFSFLLFHTNNPWSSPETLNTLKRQLSLHLKFQKCSLCTKMENPKFDSDKQEPYIGIKSYW